MMCLTGRGYLFFIADVRFSFNVLKAKVCFLSIVTFITKRLTSRVSALFSTHPPMPQRIARLEQMARSDPRYQR